MSVIYWAIVSPLMVGKLRSRWAQMWGQWLQWKNGTTMWEDGDLDGKLEVAGLHKDSGFGGPGWSRYV